MNLSVSSPPSGAAAAEWLPVEACTLPTADQPPRVAEFDLLFATALRTIERPVVPGHARLVLAGCGNLADRVQQLIDAETECCSFFTFTLTPLASGEADTAEETVLTVDIEVPLARADVLAALVQRAEQAHQAAA